ncbi:MAG TPA: S8 family serine peptidase [Actinomadura sp.]|nr:S8 family serine peptidase [Actinomadura sp.]
MASDEQCSRWRRSLLRTSKLTVCGAAAVALGSAPYVSGAALAAGTDSAGQPGGGGLPTIPSATQPGACTPRSRTVIKEMPWAQALLDPRRAWALSDGTGVKVAVVDTGVDASSGSPLAGQVITGPAVAGGSAKKADCVGHGTFVAGLIAARPRGGVGFAGIAPGAKVLAIRATAEDGSTSAAGLASGIGAAVRGGAKVVVVSAAVPAPGAKLASAVKNAAAHDVLVVAPATFEAPGSTGPGYPGVYPEVLAVGAIGPAGRSSAPMAQTAARVDLAAPGESVMSVGPGGDGHFTGSSAAFAAAFVGGTAALVRAYDPALTAAQVKSRLETTAYRPSGQVPAPVVGYGTVDPYAAVSQRASVASPAPAGAGRPDPVRLRIVAHTTSPARTALGVTAGAVALIALLGAAAVIIPRGRARGWRAAGSR